jgi:hypothetical protein
VKKKNEISFLMLIENSIRKQQAKLGKIQKKKLELEHNNDEVEHQTQND